MRDSSLGLRREWMVCGGIVLVLAALFAPALRGEVYLFDDLVTFHLPVRAFYADCLKRGESPAWHPGLFNGFDLQAEGQAGMSHPAHRPRTRFIPTRVPMPPSSGRWRSAR